MVSTIERARRYVAKCPVAISGQRGHDTTFHVASVLIHGFALSEAEALEVLREWNRGCQPPWSEAELLHKARSAANARHSRPHGFLLTEREGAPASTLSRSPKKQPASTLKPASADTPPKPQFHPMVLKRVAAKTRHLGDMTAFLGARSPVDVMGLPAAGVLRWLYPPGSGEKVLIFSDMRSQGQMVWDSNRSDEGQALPTGPEGVWFLAQPVDGRFHPNPRLGGKDSRRSEESVTAWRYVVLESDKADATDWLRCLVQMPLRIVSICESGARSIHALVRLDAKSKPDWDSRVKTIKPILVTLGADPGALSAVRLTRLPQAMRGSRVQRLLFLNPQADGTPIVDLAISLRALERRPQ